MGTLTRVARTAAAVLTHGFEVGEELAAATGTVTVTATDPTGAEPFTGPAAGPAADNSYAYTMAGQPQLTLLDVAWAGTVDGADRVEVDQVEICGGFFFTLQEGRASDSSLKDPIKYPLADLRRARTETEQECEWICAQAWVPRYGRAVLDGTGTPDLQLPVGGDEMRGGVLLRGVRTIRSAAIAPRFGQPPVPLTAGQLAALHVRTGGVLRRTDGAVWTAGDANIVIEFEWGSDAPPADLVRAAKIRFRSRLQIDKSHVPDRAVTFTVQDQGTYRLALPDAYKTGIPEVDAAYARYSRRVSSTEAPGGRAQPASGLLEFDPQWHSLFHGGRR